MTTHKAKTGEPHPVDVHVGKMIRSERIAKGMSQTALGDKLGVSFQQVQKYERGVNRVSCSMLIEVAKALDVSPGLFLPAGDGGKAEILKLIEEPGAARLLRLYGDLTRDKRMILQTVAKALALQTDAAEIED